MCAHLVPSFPFAKLGFRDSILELENWRLGETDCLSGDYTAGKLHALATHLPLRPPSACPPCASLATDYEKPSCLFHLIPLHRHTL